jgi:hypothetical protein
MTEFFQFFDMLFLIMGVGAIRFSRKSVSDSIHIKAYQNQVKEKLYSKLAVMNFKF